jgi:hypothetical protein
MATLRVALKLNAPLGYAKGLMLDMRKNYPCGKSFAMPLLRAAVGDNHPQGRQ